MEVSLTNIPYCLYFRFWVSLTFSMCINLAMKTLTAVPRPHFIDTCQPRWDIINCSAHGGWDRISGLLCLILLFLAMSILTWLCVKGMKIILTLLLIPSSHSLLVMLRYLALLLHSPLWVSSNIYTHIQTLLSTNISCLKIFIRSTMI